MCHDTMISGCTIQMQLLVLAEAPVSKHVIERLRDEVSGGTGKVYDV